MRARRRRATALTTPLGPVSSLIRDRLGARLQERRVVVWYDAERRFEALLPNLDLPACAVVSATGSRLRARRAADAVYRQLNEPGGSPESRQTLLMYMPAARGVTPEQRQEDPFEAFACCGGTFGDNEAESLLSLAQAALPRRADEIARIFREGRPTLESLDALPAGATYPLLRQALGVESPAEAIVQALSDAETAQRLVDTPGALVEFGRLATTEVGFPAQSGEGWVALRARVGRFLLVSELAFDLPGGLPAVLEGVPLAPDDRKARVLSVCDRLRAPALGESYVDLAEAVERELPIRRAVDAAAGVGSRDTFSCQEHRRLWAVVLALAGDDLPPANALLDGGKGSPWREAPERSLLWRVAERCRSFLDTAASLRGRTLPVALRDLIEAYVGTDGVWRLDRAQRLFEQAAAQCRHADEVEAAVQHCRARYAEAAAPWQAAFQAAVAREGWPPEHLKRQTQTFDAQVAPELADRRKTAYILVDSLRYELGRDLGDALASLGEVRVEAAAAVLPPTTQFGMAALLPGADGAFTLTQDGSELVPAIGNTPLPHLQARKAFLAARYGDRVHDLALEEALQLGPARLRRQVGNSDLLILRSRDIDSLGEGPNLFQARRLMSEVVGDLKAVGQWLADMGFQKLVFAADHGHILLPELPAGDALPFPPGRWLLRKRRALLGAGPAKPAGVLVLPARDVGIAGPVEELAVPVGFKTFGEAGGYFHEGLSLQECLVPIVVLQPRRGGTPAGGAEVSVSYRSDRFTSSVVGLKLRATSMLEHSVAVRLEAFDGSGPKAASVGQAGDCDARDPASGEITLPVGEDVSVPLVIDPDFHGSRIEVRASDAKTGAVYHRLPLRNSRMD